MNNLYKNSSLYQTIVKGLLVLVLTASGILVNGQYLISYVQNQGNPNGFNTELDNNTTGWKTIATGNVANNFWSNPDTIPFNFEFYGQSFSTFRCSQNGLLTFTTNVTGVPANQNTALPSISLPNYTIAAFWDAFTTNPPTGSNDYIYSKTIGIAPNRQHWVKWFSLEYGDNNNTFTYFAVVLEETTNKIYVVDMNYTSGTYSTTVGIQQNSSNALYATGSPTINLAVGTSNNYTENDYYMFSPPTPMVFNTAECIHPDTSFVRPAQTNAQMLRVKVNVTGNVNPLSLASLAVNTSGTTQLSNINAIRCFYTGSDSTFNANTSFGSVVISPALNNTFTGNLTLAPGDNFFWVTYDINPGASTGNFVDASCLMLTISGTQYVPGNYSPAGTRIISNDILIGSGTITNTTITYPTPYGNYYWGTRSQFLIRASELTAAGMVAGKLTSVSFNVASAQGTPLSNFTIKMGHTTLNALSGWEANTIIVYSVASYSETNGWNTHVFTTPFTWNGSSNIVVETCFNNTSYILNTPVYQSTTPFVSTRTYYADATGVCASNSSSATFSQRPNMSFGRPNPNAYDAQVATISEPASSAQAGTSVPVKVKLRNLGVYPLTKVSIGWSMNGQNQIPFNWTGNLGYGLTSADITIGNVNLTTGGFIFKSWTHMPNDSTDQDMENDTATKYVVACQGPLSGLYTAGSPTSYFKTIDDAVNSLNSCGISAPVTIRVMPGNYSGHWSLGNISGLSASNTITIESFNNDSNSVVIQYNAPNADHNYIFQFTSAKYVKLRKLTLNALSASFSRIVVVGDSSGNITVENCVLNGTSSSGTSSAHALIFTQALNTVAVDNIVVKNSRIQGGSYGLYLAGNTTNYSAGILIEKNIFLNQMHRGIYLNYHQSPQIKENTISTTGNATNYRGIFLFSCSNSILISRNKINTGNDASGIFYQDCISTASQTGKIENNFVQINTTQNTGSAGISMNNTVFQNIYYNSVNVTGSQNGSSAMTLGNTSSDINLRNNIFCNKAIGYTIYSLVQPAAFSSNFNCFYSNGTNFAFLQATYNNLTAWKNATQLDAASVGMDPLYYSSTDLHVSNPLLDNLGTPILGITVDIDGQTRSSTTPDIGADEFTIYTTDIGVLELVSPVSGNCLGTNEQIIVRIKNFGVNDINFSSSAATINVSVSGAASTTFPAYTLNSGFFAANATADITISSSFNMSTPGNYTFTAVTNLSGDQNASNNALVPTNVTNHIINTFPFIEDFENTVSGTPGVMTSGWTRENTGNFWWYLATGTTPSAGTGPVVDHTLGTNLGKFIFTEATGGATGNTASLLSPCFDLSALYKPVLRFYYHMYGTTMGNLYVDVQSNGVWSNNVWSRIGQQQTTQTAPWETGVVDLSAFSGRIQLRFRAVRGNDYFSDMALDDIVITNYPYVNLGPDVSFCNGSSVNLNAGFSPGYTYAWRKNYDPTVIGLNPILNVTTAGTYTVAVSNSFGFTSYDTIVVGVNPLPSVSFTGLQSTYCANTGLVSLIGIPAGGTFTGPGTSGNSFNTSVAGAGTHTITYSYTNANNCTNTSSLNTQVFALPSVMFTGLPTTSCANAGIITLTGMPAGGSFSGPGISGSTFNPAVAGPGFHNITYTSPPDANGCTNSQVKNIQVFTPVNVSFSGLASSYCLNSVPSTLTGTPAGGFFTGTGIAGNTFNPLGAGSGNHSVTYSVQDANGCFSSLTQQVNVFNLPLVSAGNDQIIAYGTSTTLTGFAGGGSGSFTYLWSPSNMLASSASLQNPLTVSLTTSTIFTLTVTNTGTGCQNSDEVTVIVYGGQLTGQIQSQKDTICSGEQLQLNALASGGNGTFTYQWSSIPAGFTSTLQNPVVSPVNTTTYTLTISDGSSNFPTQKIITVLPTPQPTIGGLMGPYCENTPPINVIVSPTGGILSGNGISGTIFHPSLAGPGVHLIQYQFTNTYGCQGNATKNVIIYQQPLANAGNDTMVSCGSAPITIGASPISGYFYSWSPSTGLSSSSIANPQLTPILTRYYYLSVLDLNTGCSGTDSVLITVSGAPVAVVSNDTTICKGGTAMLTASGGTSYAWSNGSLTPIIMVNPVQNTTYTVTVTDGGCSSTAQIKVNVNSVTVNLGNDTIIYWPDTTLTVDAGPGYTSYFWSTGDTTQTVTLSLSQYTAWVMHDLSCYVTDAIGCQAADTMQFMFYIGGVEEGNLQNQIRVYPNPSNGYFGIENLNPSNSIKRIEVFNLPGEKLLQKEALQGSKYHLDLSALADGIYLLRIETDKHFIFKKIAIQK